METNLFFLTLMFKETLQKKWNSKTENKNGCVWLNNSVNTLDGGIEYSHQICRWQQTGGSSRKNGYTQGQGRCSEKTPSQRDEFLQIPYAIQQGLPQGWKTYKVGSGGLGSCSVGKALVFPLQNEIVNLFFFLCKQLYS